MLLTTVRGLRLSSSCRRLLLNANFYLKEKIKEKNNFERKKRRMRSFREGMGMGKNAGDKIELKELESYFTVL